MIDTSAISSGRTNLTAHQGCQCTIKNHVYTCIYLSFWNNVFKSRKNSFLQVLRFQKKFYSIQESNTTVLCFMPNRCGHYSSEKGQIIHWRRFVIFSTAGVKRQSIHISRPWMGHRIYSCRRCRYSKFVKYKLQSYNNGQLMGFLVLVQTFWIIRNWLSRSLL